MARTQAETGKTSAEITNVGAGTAAVQVDTAMDMLREMRTDMATLRADLAIMQTWKNRHERLLDAHARWDEQVWAVLQQRGIKIEAPPPIRADST